MNLRIFNTARYDDTLIEVRGMVELKSWIHWMNIIDNRDWRKWHWAACSKNKICLQKFSNSKFSNLFSLNRHYWDIERNCMWAQVERRDTSHSLMIWTCHASMLTLFSVYMNDKAHDAILQFSPLSRNKVIYPENSTFPTKRSFYASTKINDSEILSGFA